VSSRKSHVGNGIAFEPLFREVLAVLTQ
jgi:hypothetical protein